MSTPSSPHVPPIPPIGSGQRVNKRSHIEERVDPAVSVPPPPVRERPAPRYRVLDTLRGFAVCGILLVNIGDITHLGRGLPFTPHSPSITEIALYYLVSTRFVPIFAFMFGMSLRFVSDSALGRGQSPWKVVGRRMIALLAIGFLHSLVYSDEVLTEYAVIGLLMLPIVLKAPRLLVAILGIAGTVASFAWGGSGVINVPGLFLLGAAAVAYGLPAYLEHPDRRLVMTTAALALAAVPAVIAQTHETGDPRFEYVGGIAGGIQAAVYICLVALACSWRIRKPIQTCFEPLGRMALTCYVSASFIVAPIGVALHWKESRDVAPLLAVAALVLAVQSIAARLWLRRFRYGPLEWVWRCLTWWTLVDIRRATAADSPGHADAAQVRVR